MGERNILNEREQWITPLGEFLVLWSDIVYSAYSILPYFDNSGQFAKLANLMTFSKFLQLLSALTFIADIPKPLSHRVNKLTIALLGILQFRNTIIHNPPINNFDLANSKKSTWEVFRLKKPIGIPGSGISLKKLIETNDKLIGILGEIDAIEGDFAVLSYKT
jgi:hypothetical protein